MRTLRLIAAATILVVSSSCQSSTSPPAGYCAAPRSIAVEVDVLDAVTRASIADNAMGTVVAVGYQDSLHHGTGADSLLWGGDQLGTYTVTVQRPGYADWSKVGVMVSQQGPCGNVIPVQLLALLVPVP